MSLCVELGGETWNAIFLQCVYLGSSIGSAIGPFLAHPFLSQVANHVMDNHVVVPGEPEPHSK